MKAIQRLVCYSGLLVAATAGVCAYAAGPDPAPVAQQQQQAAAASWADGEVIKADPAQHTVRLKHGEIKNLNMMGMTMNFHVKDDALFDKLKPGSKIRFTADRIDGAYTVLSVEAVQ